MNRDKRIISSVLLLFCLLISSCQKKEKQEQYVISSLAKTKDSRFTVSPDRFYGRYNFIIDTSGLIYYYGLQSRGHGCFIYTESIPPFIKLKPDQIVKIPDNSIIAFFKCNVTNSTIKTISIASQNDTINSKGFTILLNYLNDSINNTTYQVRMTTIEENTVLSYKKQNRYYDPNFINWDSTKMVFITAPTIVYDSAMPKGE